MKKFLVVLCSFVFILSLSGCKKKDNLSLLSENLTSYEINLNLDTNSKTATATQTIKYVNNTNNILKTIKFHLYLQYYFLLKILYISI